MTGQPLRFFLTKYLLMPLVFCWDSLYRFGWDSFGMEDDSSNVVFAWPSYSWDVSLSRNKGSFFCIVGLQYDRELSVIDPSLFPVDFWLGCYEPGVPYDCLLFS